MTAEPLIAVRGVHKRFPVRRSALDWLLRREVLAVQALAGVDLDINRGETLGVVGESGCGKSTLARCLVRLLEPDEGLIRFDGKPTDDRSREGRRRFHRRVQITFQDPYSALNPRMTVRQVLAEALAVHRMRPASGFPSRIAELLDLVRLPQDAADRLPHAFSGGQRQRIGIARALAVEPDVLVADELVSALDVSVQAQVINLLLDLQGRLGLTVVFVAHDLRLVRHISHRVAVMYLGRVVEVGPTEALFSGPVHPYTVALLAAAPDLNPRRRTTRAATLGELPSPLAIPPGCPYQTRCPFVFDRCRTERPVLTEHTPGHAAACHRPA
ncbi:MAG: ATP-binding cassette domain-containing protein [Acetobacteraceae bacterium]|nr:ATP-binding cassette domain-containing protein [Acetobacteraceae bacterium]